MNFTSSKELVEHIKQRTYDAILNPPPNPGKDDKVLIAEVVLSFEQWKNAINLGELLINWLRDLQSEWLTIRLTMKFNGEDYTFRDITSEGMLDKLGTPIGSYWGDP